MFYRSRNFQHILSAHSFSSSSIPITIPNLSAYEEIYIFNQLNVIKELGDRTINYISRQDYLKEFKNIFPGFKNYQYKRKLASTTSVIVARRTSVALKDAGVLDEDLNENPELAFYPLRLLPRDARLSRWLNIPMCQISSYLSSHKVSSTEFCSFARQVEVSAAGLFTIETEKLDYMKQKLICPNISYLEIFYGHNYSDPLMYMRNKWIFSNLLKTVDFDSSYIIRSALKNTCPIETLIILNSFYSIYSSYVSVDVFLEKFRLNAIHNIVYPSFGFPVSVRERLLRDIGFEANEVRAVLLSHHKSFSERKLRKSHQSTLDYTSPDYLPTMQERLRMLRVDGLKIGVFDAVDIFTTMINWHQLMDNLKKIFDRREFMLGPIALKQFRKKGAKIEVGTLSWKISPVSKYLTCFFELTTEEEILNLYREMSHSIYNKSVPLIRVANAISFLTSEGFHRDHLLQVISVLFYPKSKLAEKLQEVRTSFGGSLTDLTKLQILLYLIEKEHNFTGVSVCSNFAEELGDNLFKFKQNLKFSK